MKVVIMAAGKGTRISRYIKEIPKCTLKISNTTLIENMIKNLKKKEINEIAIVVGYKSEYIKNLLKHEEIKFYYNPFFDVTNSITSLWFAKEFLSEDDVLFLNADVFYEGKLLDKIIEEKKSPVLFADPTRHEEADYKFLYEDGILKKYGKHLLGKEITGEYIGAGKINKEFLPRFIERLDELIYNQKHGMWWEDVLYSFTKELDIYVENINDMFWGEVDYIEDYQRIVAYLENRA